MSQNESNSEFAARDSLEELRLSRLVYNLELSIYAAGLPTFVKKRYLKKKIVDQ